MPNPILMPSPRQRFFDGIGLPLVRGYVFTFAAGTSTKLAAYQDAAGLIPHENPIRLDDRGEATIYWLGNYKVDLRTAGPFSSQVPGYPVDNFNASPPVTSADVDASAAQFKTSAGSGLVGFMQAGTGALLRTVQKKLEEYISATEFGAIGDGLADDSSFEASALAQATKTRSIFRSLDMYKFPRIGGKFWKRTFGIKDQAAVVSISCGDDTTEPVTQVLGFAMDSDVSVYGDRDHVGLFVQSSATPPTATTADTVFTATSVTSSSFAGLITGGKIKRGMLIDTTETPKKTGVITGASGNTITVSAWYIVDSSRSTATPAAGTTVLVNPSTKVWALNANVLLPANAQANNVVGLELGLVNDKADGMGYLYDAVNLGSKKGGTAFQSRGGFVEGMHIFPGTQFGITVNAATSIGAYVTGGPVSFQSDSATAISYLAKDAALALVVQDGSNATKTLLDGIGRWSLFKGKLNLFGANSTIDGCYVAALTGTPVNLPDPTGNNAERILFVQNGTAGVVTAAGPIAGGAGGLTIAAGKCVQVISNGSAWVPLSQY